MDVPIGIGIIGLGAIGRTHAQAIATIPGARVVAVTGRSDLAGAVRFDAAGDLLARNDVDVVGICSPPGVHAEQIRLAIEAGKHAVVEKSPTRTAEELAELAELAADRGVHISVVSQQRLLPHPRHIAQLLHSGRLGHPLLGEIRLHWHRPQSYYEATPWRSTDPHAGSLANQGWHALDLLSWFYGPVQSVGAMTATLGHRIEVEDTTSATMRFRSGALGSVVTTTATPPGRPSTLTLLTDQATITLSNSTIEQWDVPAGTPEPPPDSAAGSGAADPTLIGIAGHRALWCDVVDALRDGRAPTVTAIDGARTVGLIEAVYESGRTGTLVTPWNSH
ncbi:MAG TPA: Gfo/Idh/MocA family oxidoreductase [Mycobacteriales bacterium]|nr:Gfo/Idh/MocA family oxidoreductase [Mycobacteriales bacterium]